MKTKAPPRRPRASSNNTLPIAEPPPHDDAAEKNVIGCAFARPSAVAPLKAEHFYSSKHQLVWGAILELKAEGREVDPHVVIDRLRAKKSMRAPGDKTRDDLPSEADVLELGDVVISSSNVDIYARHVHDAWAKGEAAKGAHDLAEAALNPYTSLDEVQRKAAAAMPHVTIDKAREDLAGLEEKAKADPGAPFEPVLVDALALIARESPHEWQRIRLKLKTAGVRVRDLEKEMSKRTPAPQRSTVDDDEAVRMTVSKGTATGWYSRTEDQAWIACKFAEARARAAGDDSDMVLRRALERPWELVNLPFKPEYPVKGRRLWNRDAAQLAFAPKPGPHPTWDRVLDHVGRGLDYAIARDPWCAQNAIRTGGDYLRLWAAALLQEPLEPLPFLFLHGPQNTGKTTYHEALALLLTTGYAVADQALTSTGGFNGELAGALLCVVEETDLRNEKAAVHRIKDWVTSRTISIHAKNRTPYWQANATHWIQTANSITHCPVLRGDTRITVIAVAPLDDEIPKMVLIEQLRAEAPAFTHTATTARLPAPQGRLRIPVVETNEKRDQMHANRTDLERYLDDRREWLAMTPEEIAKRFHASFPAAAAQWSVARIARELLNVEADTNRVGAPRSLARALRGWFEAGGRRPRSGLTGEVLKQLEGTCSTWAPNKAGRHRETLVPALAAVGILFSWGDVTDGTEWRFGPGRRDEDVLAAARGGVA